MKKTIAVIGSTGSVGRQTLEVAGFFGISVDTLCANGSDIKLLEEQVRRFSPRACAVVDEAAAAELTVRISDMSTVVLSGEAGVMEAVCTTEADTVFNSVMGEAGLMATLKAIGAGKNVALSNKESLVAAGDIVMREAAANGVSIIPVDSEHCAVMQCLSGNRQSDVSRLLLTASGGPFFGKKRYELEKITVSDALCHPTWSMGKKITVDSATLMNKGLEIIEATHLFSVPEDKIDVVVHRESIIHSMVEYNDSTVIAQLGTPDMRLCIQNAMFYPERQPGLTKKLDFTKLRSLSFAEADTDTFTLLPLARFAIRCGGIIPAVMNAANEAAVDLFIKEKIKLTDIFDLVCEITRGWKNISLPGISDIFMSDKAARELTYKTANNWR